MRNARLLAQQAQVDLTAGRLSGDKRQRLDDYLVAWIDSKRTGLAPKTFDSYDPNRRRLAPYIGSVRIEAWRPSHVQQAYSDLASTNGLSPKSIRQAHRLLHASLQDAVCLGLVPMNVTDSTSPPRDAHTEMKTLTVSQVVSLFRAAHGDSLYALWVVLATTGLRLGEARGLRWGDIGFHAGNLRVQRSLQRQGGGKGLVCVNPKTASSRRTVDLTSVALQALQDHRALWLDRRNRLGDKWQGSDIVFASDFGTPLDPTSMPERLDRLLARAGLPRIRVHDLRHNAATLALQQGVNPKVVQEMLGHSSITLTLGTYSHVLPPMRREVANRLDALFNEAIPSSQPSFQRLGKPSLPHALGDV
jgi:integrase